MENESNSNTVFQRDDELPSFSVGLEFLAPKATNNNNGAAPTPGSSRFATLSEHEMQQISSVRATPRKYQENYKLVSWNLQR